MAEPPKTPPHSDIAGVNRDARAQTPQKDEQPNAGELQAKNEQTKARPEETAPPE